MLGGTVESITNDETKQRKKNFAARIELGEYLSQIIERRYIAINLNATNQHILTCDRCKLCPFQ